VLNRLSGVHLSPLSVTNYLLQTVSRRLSSTATASDCSASWAASRCWVWS